MNFIFDLIKSYSAYIILALLFIIIIEFIIILCNSAGISKLKHKYRKFTRGGKNKNIEELLTDIMGKLDNAVETSDKMKNLYGGINERLDKCIQKVSLLRYKAFDDMGSAALSFSIALLDAHNDGFIITGIYGSDECATYAKPVEKGIPKYNLSDEEKQVLEEAMKKRANINN